MLQVINDKGIKFNVLIVRKGDTYGLNDCLTHDEDRPLVEFYDDRYKHGFGMYGQFVSRYYADTLLKHSTLFGIDLEGSIADWEISADNVKLVQEYIYSKCENFV